MSPTHGHLTYRREIDGLRAVAVVAVVLFHAGVPGFDGGFVGVDVFFVISGYLITRILLNSIRDHSFSLGSFYARRARRILPALFLVLLASLPLAWLTLQPTDLADFGLSLLATSLFGSNLLFAARESYFEARAELNPLLHTWSLSVEEQFYLLFPAALWWLSSASLSRWRTAVITFLAFLSLAIASYQTLYQPSAAFYLPYTRFWELAMGSLVAMYVEPRLQSLGHIRWRGAFAGFGMLLILLSVFFYGSRTPIPGLPALAPTVGAALIILFSSPRDLVGRILGTRLAVAIGLISYSLYLWHHLLFAFFRHVEIEPSNAAVWMMLTLLSGFLSYLSWRFVEMPARQGSRGLSTKFILGTAALISVLFALIGWTLHAQAGFPSRLQHVFEWAPDYQPDNRRLQAESWNILRTMHKAPDYSVTDNPHDKLNRFRGEGKAIKVLIIGNSHSKDTFNMLFLNRDLFTTFDFARYGLQLACMDASSELFEAPSYRAADVILVSTRWNDRQCPGTSEYRHDFLGLDILHERTLADGKTLVITAAAPEFRQIHNKTVADVLILNRALWGRNSMTPEDVRLLAQHINQQLYEARISVQELREFNGKLRQWADERNLIVLDKEPIACDEASRACLGVSEVLGKYMFDRSHYTLDGARRLGLRAHDLGWLAPVEQQVRLKQQQ